MRRGEIRPYRPIGPRQDLYVLVLSSDDFNDSPVARPLCVDIDTRRAPSELSVPLGQLDPVDGVVRVATIGARSRDALGEPVGMVTGATLSRTVEAIHVLLDLPCGSR